MTDRGGKASLLAYTPAGVTGSNEMNELKYAFFLLFLRAEGHGSGDVITQFSQHVQSEVIGQLPDPAALNEISDRHRVLFVLINLLVVAGYLTPCQSRSSYQDDLKR